MAIEKLAEFLEKEGMKKSDFANIAGFEPYVLSKILSKKRTPTLTQAAAIEKLTGISASSWVTAESEAA